MPAWLYSGWLDKMYKISNYDEYKEIKSFSIKVEEHNEIENIAFFIKENLNQKRIGIEGIKSFIKIIRSFLMNNNLIDSKALEYDRFEK